MFQYPGGAAPASEMSGPQFDGATASRFLRERYRDDVAVTPDIKGVVAAVVCDFAAKWRPGGGRYDNIGISKHAIVRLTCARGYRW